MIHFSKMPEKMYIFFKGKDQVKESILKSYLNKISLCEMAVQDIHRLIVQYFSKNPSPSLSDVRRFAEDHGMLFADFEEHVFMILGNLLKGIGKHKHVPDSAFDPRELEMGEKVELEHTDNRELAKEIAKDHLSECTRYYTFLKNMELKCKKE